MRFVVEKADEPLSVSAADVISWGAPREAETGELLLLADGGLIVADVAGVDEKFAEVDSRVLGKLKVPAAKIRAIVFSPPTAALDRDQFLRKAKTKRVRSDEVWLTNGDTQGGAVALIDENAVYVRQAERTVELPIENVAAVVFAATVAEPVRTTGLYAVVGFSDGSLIVADCCVFTQELPTAELQSGELTASAKAEEIVFVQPFGGRATYLSDLKPTNYRHIPLLDLKWDYRADANVLGGSLRCREHLYLKGLGAHSASVLTYRVPEGAKRLVGRVGIDDSAESGGSVVFRVFVDDGSGKWQPRFTSKTVRGGDAPQDISIDLAGARQISLMVDFADRGDVLDHADWLDLTFVK